MFERLIEQGLVKEKKYTNGLSVFKYTRKVFYDALWETDPLLLEARGMVLDAQGNKVIWPFTKVFNYMENGTGVSIHPDRGVELVEKKNGFMAAAASYKGDLIVSTTGTLDSDFAKLARTYIERLDTALILEDHTYIFEICSPEDPHIVQEEEGAYLIGIRNHISGEMFSERALDSEAYFLNGVDMCKRPEHFLHYWGDVDRLVRQCRMEGYMVRNASTGETLMKIKSPYYLSTKFLMRMGKGKQEQMFDNSKVFKETIDEEFYGVVDYIVENFNAEQWNAFKEQERRVIIEEYFNATR